MFGMLSGAVWDLSVPTTTFWEVRHQTQYSLYALPGVQTVQICRRHTHTMFIQLYALQDGKCDGLWHCWWEAHMMLHKSHSARRDCHTTHMRAPCCIKGLAAFCRRPAGRHGVCSTVLCAFGTLRTLHAERLTCIPRADRLDTLIQNVNVNVLARVRLL